MKTKVILRAVLFAGLGYQAPAQTSAPKFVPWYQANIDADQARQPGKKEPVALKPPTPAEKAAQKVMVRKLYAGVLDTMMLKNGVNAEVTARGTTLQIKWILASRVTAYQISQQTETFENAWDAGFDRITLTDGFSDTYSWDLRKLKRSRP